jgi:hypothetical protein
LHGPQSESSENGVREPSTGSHPGVCPPAILVLKAMTPVSYFSGKGNGFHSNQKSKISQGLASHPEA